MLERIERVGGLLCATAEGFATERERALAAARGFERGLAEARAKCLRVLALFVEEVQFMQRLARSDDLQACLFPRPDGERTQVLDEASRDEWVRHCAGLSRFVEDATHALDADHVGDAFAEFQKVRATEIFDFMSGDTLERRMRMVLERLDPDSIESGELFAMFCAQVFTNSILQSHSVKLRMRCDLAWRERGRGDRGPSERPGVRYRAGHAASAEAGAEGYRARVWRFRGAGWVGVVSVVRDVLKRVGRAGPRAIETLRIEKEELVEQLEGQIGAMEGDVREVESAIAPRSARYGEWVNPLSE